MSDDWAFPLIQPIRDPDVGVGFLPWAKGQLFRLRAPWPFSVNVGGFSQSYVIPAGYEFDKASIPPPLWLIGYLPDGLCTVPALVHDFLCDLHNGGSPWLTEALQGQVPPAPPATLIHLNFYNMLLAEGVRPRKALAMYQAVRLFGPGGLLRPSTLWSKMKA